MDASPAPPDSILISALEHWSYCPRQCGLIHLEKIFRDNLHTVRGQHAHERAHEEDASTQAGVRIARGMTLWSDELGLTGKSDVVEFHGDQPYPVEYKVGRRGPWVHAEIQLGAQAMCLEEMLGVSVPRGAVFYRASRRRAEVEIDNDLRTAVTEAIGQIRTMLDESAMPPPVDDARCPQCSLVDICMPGVVVHQRRLRLLDTELFKADGWLAGEGA